MFVQAIDQTAKFTRALHFISRKYDSTEVTIGAATLFCVNSDGWALTCGHVADQIIAINSINDKYRVFKGEVATLRGTKKYRQILRELEKTFGYSKPQTVELLCSFINCVEGQLSFRILRHQQADVALIKLEQYTKLLCDTFPIFPSDTTNLKQGKLLCRLGFPFPDFTNYTYDAGSDSISWTKSGKIDSPRFPIEGMLTRHLADKDGVVYGFEMSTPGLKGQSGGPAFDSEGRIWGMQSATAHLDLDFDVDQEVIRNGEKKRVKDSAFLHVGHCIHVEVLKSFMKANGVQFQEG